MIIGVRSKTYQKLALTFEEAMAWGQDNQPSTNDQITKKLLERIRKCEKQIDNLKTLPYYTLFKQQTEQQNDIAAVMQKLEKLREEYSVYSY